MIENYNSNFYRLIGIATTNFVYDYDLKLSKFRVEINNNNKINKFVVYFNLQDYIKRRMKLAKKYHIRVKRLFPKGKQVGINGQLTSMDDGRIILIADDVTVLATQYTFEPTKDDIQIYDDVMNEINLKGVINKCKND